MKAIRWLLKLVLVMITLPLLLAVWLAKWFVVFLHHCSAWFFYLLGSETIENFGGNSSTGLSSRMIQLSGISWMLIHNAVFGLGASCHTRGKLSYRINGIWQVRDTIDNGYVGYFVEEGLLGGIACFSLFYSLLKSSWKKATFKNSRNMNNSFFLCFVSYVAVMLSVADVSQLLWVIIALYITYNAKAQAIASE